MWWENEFLKVSDRKLYLGRRRAERLAGEYGTPLLVYNRRQILSNYHRLKSIFAGCEPRELRIYYAMKANSHRKILETLRQQGA
jgi:diaminopimelate decarboxylase